MIAFGSLLMCLLGGATAFPPLVNCVQDPLPLPRAFGTGAVGLFVEGDFAYMTFQLDKDNPIAATGVLRILNVADVAHPKIVGGEQLALPVLARCIFVDKGYAYIGFEGMRGTNSFRVVDVSNPERPFVAGGGDLELPATVRDIKIEGRYAYLAYHDGAPNNYGLGILDISDPAHPKAVCGPVALQAMDETSCGQSRGLAVKDGFVYLTLYVYGPQKDGQADKLFRIVDARDPAHPILVPPETYRDNELFWGGRSAAISGNYLFLAGGPWGSEPQNSLAPDTFFQIFDISAPAAPHCIGGRNIHWPKISPEVSCALMDVKIADNFAYVTTASNSLTVIDISDPFHPAIATQFEKTSEPSWPVFVRGSDIFVGYGTGENFNPSSPAMKDGLLKIFRFAGSWVDNASTNAVLSGTSPSECSWNYAVHPRPAQKLVVMPLAEAASGAACAVASVQWSLSPNRPFVEARDASVSYADPSGNWVSTALWYLDDPGQGSGIITVRWQGECQRGGASALSLDAVAIGPPLWGKIQYGDDASAMASDIRNNRQYLTITDSIAVCSQDPATRLVPLAKEMIVQSNTALFDGPAPGLVFASSVSTANIPEREQYRIGWSAETVSGMAAVHSLAAWAPIAQPVAPVFAAIPESVALPEGVFSDTIPLKQGTPPIAWSWAGDTPQPASLTINPDTGLVEIKVSRAESPIALAIEAANVIGSAVLKITLEAK